MFTSLNYLMSKTILDKSALVQPSKNPNRRSRPRVVALNGRSSETDSQPYLKELGISIVESPQRIQFMANHDSLVHGWSPYVQGFSHSFVQGVLDFYQLKTNGHSATVLDPFAGAGTVLVQAKLNGIPSVGTELNPLLAFIAKTKLTSWDVNGQTLIGALEALPRKILGEAPDFLQSDRHFNPPVLSRLRRLRGGIESLEQGGRFDPKIINLLKVAFSSILIDCSNLTRSPCLGYSKSKIVPDEAPYILFESKVSRMAKDLKRIRAEFTHRSAIESTVLLGDARTVEHKDDLDLIVTSPPYMNGIDYVINYKIEMAWLGFVNNHKEAKRIKDQMVVCDNVSKHITRDFSKASTSYSNRWIAEIKEGLVESIRKRQFYRRLDMPEIVHKYFDDLWSVYQRILPHLKNGGRFVLVVGDSFIADVYLPTDLILARMGQEYGLEIERIELARRRRSGQVLSYKLRETIVTLRKP